MVHHSILLLPGLLYYPAPASALADIPSAIVAAQKNAVNFFMFTPPFLKICPAVYRRFMFKLIAKFKPNSIICLRFPHKTDLPPAAAVHPHQRKTHRAAHQGNPLLSVCNSPHQRKIPFPANSPVRDIYSL